MDAWPSLPKTMLAIGKARFSFPSTPEMDGNITSRHYSVRIHFQGQRESFSLYTGNKAAAAAKARDIYTALVTKGWPATREQYKAADSRAPKSVVTVSDFFNRIRETHTGREGTLEEYFGAFRLIVADSFGIDGTKLKYDYRARGRARWLERVRRSG